MNAMDKAGILEAASEAISNALRLVDICGGALLSERDDLRHEVQETLEREVSAALITANEALDKLISEAPKGAKPEKLS